MAASNRLRWKRLLNELKFLHEERDLLKSICEEAGPEFQIHYEEFCIRNKVDLKSLNQKHGEKIQSLYSQRTIEQGTPPLLAGLPVLYEEPAQEKETPYKMTKDEMEIHEAFKKIFRKLALILHPDKLVTEASAAERAEKLKMFKEAKSAIEKRRYFKLLELAEFFKVRLPRNYKQQSRWMKREIVRIEEEIDQEKRTYNYRFADCDTESQKDTLVEAFIRQVFGLQISSK